MVFANVRNNEIVDFNSKYLNEDIIQVQTSEDMYTAYLEDALKVMYFQGEIVLNPNYETDKQRKKRAELDSLVLTPSDVERALYKAKNMDFDDLKELIIVSLPDIDIKALSIEFRAKDFYRGAVLLGGIRLFDTIGALLGYNSDDMDYLFINKELPVKLEQGE